MIGWWEATSTSMRRANRSWAATAAISASTCSGGPAITVWRGEAYTAKVTCGIVGDQRLGAFGVQFQQRHRALAGQPRHQPRPGGDHPQTLGRRSAPRPPPPR